MAVTRLAYVLAASHSGSTLLTMLLNSHPDIATVGELSPGHMEDTSWYRCSCGAKITECPFWDSIATTAREKGLGFRLEDFGTGFRMRKSRVATRLLRPLHRGPMLEMVRDMALALLTCWPARFKDVARANEVLVQAILEYHGAHILLDKGNTALRLKYLSRIPSFDVRVIHLIRDGRAVALTYMDPADFADARDAALRGGGSGGNRQDERLPMDRAAHEWRRCNEEAEYALRRLSPSQWIQVHYEELCKDPDAALARVFAFLGLDPERRIRDFRSVENHIVGNGMRLDSTCEIRLDERWREVLTQDDLRTFDTVAGRMNRKYGYI